MESLVIEIKASNSQIVSRLDQADRKLAAFEKSAVGRIAKIESTFGRLGAGLSKGLALLGSAAALGGLTHLVKNSLEAADNIGDLATKLGVGTTELQQWQHVAALSGVEAGSLDSAIVKLNIAIAKSADTNSAAAEAFGKLGINVRNFSSTGEVFNAVMEKIGASQLSAAQQTKLMVPLMGRGSAALRVMSQSFKELRDQAPVISEEDIRNAAELNDKWDAMARLVDTQLKTALIKLGPVIEGLIGLLGRAADGVGLLFEKANESARQLTLTDLKATIKQLEILQNRKDEPGFFDNVFGDPDALNEKIAEVRKHAHELQEELSHLTPGGPKLPTKSQVPALGALVGEDETKAKKGKRGPDFEGIFNRFAEEAARTEASLQERIATITGDVTQLQITALAEVEAKRQTSIHQAKGDVQALAQIEKTAALDTLAVQLNVIDQLIDADKRSVQEAEDAARRRLEAIQSEADARHGATENTVENIRQQLDLATNQGAPLQRLITLRQQEGEAIRATAQADIETSQQKIAATQAQMAELRELIDARKLLAADITTARDTAPTDLDKGVQEARLIGVNKLLQEMEDRYAALTSTVQQLGEEQRRVGEEQRNFIHATTGGIQEQITAEETRIAIISRAITQNQNYDSTQREIENTIKRLTLQQEALKLGVTPEEIASLDAILNRYQLVQSQSETLNEALQKQAQDQQEMHDLVASGISDIGHELLDMARTGEFSFKRLVDAANRFGDRLADRAFDELADSFADILFPKAAPNPLSQLPPLLQPSTAVSAISGPFEVSTLSKQLEGLQVPVVSTSTAGIQQLTAAGVTATQALTQTSTASLTTIQTTGTTAITSLQQVATSALAAIQAASGQGGAGKGLAEILGPGSTSTPGTGVFSNVQGGSSSTAQVPVIPPETFAPVITSMQTTGQDVTRAVGQTGLSVITQTGTAGAGILSQLAQFACSALSALLTAVTTQSAGSSGGSGWMSIFSSLFSSFGGSGGGASFGNVTAGSSSTAAFVHSGGTIGKTVLPTRAVSPTLFDYAPRFHEGLQALQSSHVARHFVPVLHEGTMMTTASQTRDRLKPDEFPAILQTGETVLSRSQVKEIHKEIGVAQGLVGKDGKPGAPGSHTLSTLTNILAPIFHEGGTVGGSSTAVRNVSSAIFHNAPRFHEGRIPGKPAPLIRPLVSVLHDGAKHIPAPHIDMSASNIFHDAPHFHEGLRSSSLTQHLVSVLHEGDTSTSVPQTRLIAPAIFHHAPRFHDGLMPDEFPAILQTGEDVMSRQQLREIRQRADVMPHMAHESDSGSRRERPVVVNINGVQDFNSFKRNEQQVQAAIARSTARASKKNN